MAYQLGALGAIKTPELVKMSKPTSGNYSELFGQMNRNQEALGKREDRATLNALGSARAEAIMGGQAGSAALQGIRDAQAKALEAQDVPLYDKLTGDLKAQMQIESAEAKADPLGKNQLGRDRLAQSQKKGRELPLIEQAVRDQTSAKENALNILDEYFNLEGDKDKAVKSQYRQRYMDEWRKQKDAMATLSRYSDSSSHNFQKLDEWSKAIAGGAKERNAEAVANATIEKLMAEAGMSREEAKGYAKKLEMEEKEREQKLRFEQESQGFKREKEKLDLAVKKGAEVRKELADLDLAKPAYYEGLKSQAKVTANAKNPFILAKLLSQIIEKGLAVNEGEVRGLMGANDSSIRKWVDQLTGAPEDKILKLQSLITELADNRIEASKGVLSRSQYNTNKKTEPKKTEVKALSFDPATGKFF